MPNNPAFSFLLRNGTFETLIDRKRSYGKDHCTVAYKVGDIKEPHSFNHYIYFNNPVCNRTDKSIAIDTTFSSSVLIDAKRDN